METYPEVYMPVGAVADEQVPSTDGHILILEEVLL